MQWALAAHSTASPLTTWLTTASPLTSWLTTVSPLTIWLTTVSPLTGSITSASPFTTWLTTGLLCLHCFVSWQRNQVWRRPPTNNIKAIKATARLLLTQPGCLNHGIHLVGAAQALTSSPGRVVITPLCTAVIILPFVNTCKALPLLNCTCCLAACAHLAH